jgi:hypothetical protein
VAQFSKLHAFDARLERSPRLRSPKRQFSLRLRGPVGGRERGRGAARKEAPSSSSSRPSLTVAGPGRPGTCARGYGRGCATWGAWGCVGGRPDLHSNNSEALTLPVSGRTPEKPIFSSRVNTLAIQARTFDPSTSAPRSS